MSQKFSINLGSQNNASELADALISKVDSLGSGFRSEKVIIGMSDGSDLVVVHFFGLYATYAGTERLRGYCEGFLAGVKFQVKVWVL